MTADILLVDDNPEACMLLSELLEMEGHTVRTASDGAGALALMRERTAPLLLLDQHLPDMEGTELVQRLRALAEAQGMPCIAIAITGMPGGAAGAGLPGFDHVLGKPLDFDAFDAVIAKSCAALR